jgi:phosphoenolpyruvate phosphomutase
LKKTTQLKTIINSPQNEFILEAHNGLSAKIVEESGFPGIWASGLSMSASLGVRDNNEASWTQILEIAEFMVDATNIPVLLDGDTGYGNFNNMRRLVNKLEQRGIAGVCIEDKLFPKTNSFIGGKKQLLAEINEFCGKLSAGKDTQKDDDFIIVARVEAFIAGLGLAEALDRADAYRKAGADAILIHSNLSTATEIADFMNEWGGRHPVVIVPTKYYSTPSEFYSKLGISLTIWANHNIRTSINAMQELSKKIYEDQSLTSIEGKISPLSEVFRLQGAKELQEMESMYLPSKGRDINAIVLAASQGKELGELTVEIPKAMLKVRGKSILETQIKEFNEQGINNISIVRGFSRDTINFSKFNMIDNELYESTTELYSLSLALDHISKETIICYGDIVFKSYILHELLVDDNNITIVVDTNVSSEITHCDFVIADMKYSKDMFFDTAKLIKFSCNHTSTDVSGEFIGLFKVNEKGAEILKNTIKELSLSKDFKKMRIPDLFNEILEKTEISIKYISGDWIDVNTITSLQSANQL